MEEWAEVAELLQLILVEALCCGCGRRSTSSQCALLLLCERLRELREMAELRQVERIRKPSVAGCDSGSRLRNANSIAADWAEAANRAMPANGVCAVGMRSGCGGRRCLSMAVARAEAVVRVRGRYRLGDLPVAVVRVGSVFAHRAVGGGVTRRAHGRNVRVGSRCRYSSKHGVCVLHAPRSFDDGLDSKRRNTEC